MGSISGADADCACVGCAGRRFYNPGMLAATAFLPRLLLALCGLAAATALAQTAAPQPRGGASAPRGGPEQKIERIRHEDAGSRIDELRVGGETKHITVSPKGNAPA